MKITHCVLALAGLAAASGAWAKDKEQSWSLDGASLAIASPCAKTVTIEPDVSLDGKIQVVAKAERQAEIDQLEVTGGTAATIKTHEKACKGAGWHFVFSLFRSRIVTGPSLAITVKVPVGLAIDIAEAKASDYEIGAVGGVLHLDLSGSGDVAADEAKDPVVHLSGSGSARFEEASGTLDGKLSGSGDIWIGRADLARTDLKSSGSGDVEVEDGKVGALTVALSGTGAVRLDAGATDADLALSGSGDIHLQEASGQIRKSRHGNGEIVIGDH